MIFRVVIDKESDEEIVATVHQRTALIDEIEMLVAGNSRTDVLAVYREDEIRLLDISEAECIMVEDGRTWVVSDGGTRYLLKQRLYEVEGQLPPEFIRINKSSIANRKKIVRFTTNISGAVNVEFQSGFSDYVSRRCFADIKRRYGI